jgi:hypothetical protein
MADRSNAFWQEIEAVQELIFDYRINEAFSRLSAVVDDLNVFMKDKDENTMKRINRVFSDINEAIVNKDYLLVADLLEHDLKKSLKSGVS